MVGGVAAGLSAAARAKRIDPGLDVTVFERTHHCAYTSCGLPYYVGGVITDADRLVMRTPAAMAQAGVRVHTRHEVRDIDLRAGQLTVDDLDSGRERAEPFDRLVVATGARPIVPFAGADAEGVFVLRTVEDAEAIAAWLPVHRPNHGVIIGGGYIALEMAEALISRGVHTTVIEREAQLLSVVDADMAGAIERELAAHGATVLTNTTVLALTGVDPVRGVETDHGTIAGDLVIVAAGVRPETGLADSIGVKLGPHHGAAVDEQMATNLANVWAAGDCCETRHLMLESAYVPLGTTANKQGRIAGANVAGGAERFRGVLGTSALKVCDLEVARTGLSARQATEAGLDAVAETITHVSRAAYYPGGSPMSVRVVAERRSGRLLGAQLVGREGVAKRVDVVAAALHANMDVETFSTLDLSYAPPYAPVWDPLLIAARATAGAA